MACATLALATFSGAARATERGPIDDTVAQQPAKPEPKPDAAATAAEDRELQEALAEERHECDRLRRRGDLRAATKRLEELLAESPGDAEARVILALCRFDAARYEAAIEDGEKALALAREGADSEARRALRARCARTLAVAFATLGRAREACELLERESASLVPTRDARDAWVLGSSLELAGDRERSRAAYSSGARTPDDQPWDGLSARGECQRRLGDLETASASLVLADRAAKAADGVEPDVLAALGDLYFEADREVEAAQHRSAAALYKEALSVNPAHEASLLGLFRLHRYNWMRQSRPASDFLDQLFRERPDSIPGRVAAAGADLDDGQLKSARERLAELDRTAPRRRDVRTLVASLAWIEHRRDDCERALAELAQEDAHDSAPEREVGRHLLELYRFAEGLLFVRRAVERDELDHEAWTQLGRALANTGDETAALEALDRAQDRAGLRQDAWRDNTRMVLRAMAAEHVHEKSGDLTFAWNPDADRVFATYLMPFYEKAREELSQRYGYTPGPTVIEVFRRHRDFSVRSTGFEGFPALGVCFGPVVTAVSPLSELRGTFSWARTSFHEFTHVIHLGLSHNRCPRWITEGLATWEEVARNPAWTRNMRRDLLDALANGEIIATRDLNRAFRGPRILFGYYQGGLMCQLLIDRNGFPPMVRLLEAFDRGLDLDQALDTVFHVTPEALDRDFKAFVERETKDLKIEPRWSPARLARLRATLARTPPKSESERARWAEDGCTLAWGLWQQGRKVDAEEALRRIQDVKPPPVRAEFLRGEMALVAGDRPGAIATWEAALARGGEDFRVRMALGRMALDEEEWETAEKHFLAAKRCFPGFDDPAVSAELALVAVYTKTDREDAANQEREAWLAYNAGDLKERRKVAAWHMEHARYKEAAIELEHANEVDPFVRSMHREWGLALKALSRHEEALREFEMVTTIAASLDAERKTELEDGERAEALGLQAACLAELGKNSDALERARKALELDADCQPAREVIEKLH